MVVYDERVALRGVQCAIERESTQYDFRCSALFTIIGQNKSEVIAFRATLKSYTDQGDFLKLKLKARHLKKTRRRTMVQ